MKRVRTLMVAAMSCLAAACFHQVVQTGMAAGPKVIDKPWTATWIFGLVPAQPIDVTQECPGGIATVTTEMTVPNWLASAVTLGIYDPRHVTIACARGATSVGAQEIDFSRTAPVAVRQAAFEQAVARAIETNQPVVLRF